jgi:capsular polysaccharide biosynthesis protein
MVELPSRNGASSGQADAGPPADAPVDMGRIGAALRRDRRLIIAIVVVVSGLVFVVSSLSPVRYSASARIADDPVASGSVDSTTADRQLATNRALVNTPAVLKAAAAAVPGATADSLSRTVSATVDPAASILDIAVTDANPERAALLANAVAGAFLNVSAEDQQALLTQAQERLQKELTAQRKRGAKGATLQALRSRFGDIAADGVLAGTGLRLVQPATAPTTPASPHPLRSTVFAVFASLLVAGLIAVARDRLRRRRPDAQALSETVDVPLLAALPVVGRRRRRGASTATDGAMLEETALQAAVRAALPPRAQRVVLVHGMGPDSHAPVVAAALARALAWAGHATVLLRLGGSAERSAEADRWAPEITLDACECADLEEGLRDLKPSPYRYVIVQSPRQAPNAQLRGIAADIAGIVLVARLGTASDDDAMEARRLVDALALQPLGLVITCTAADRTLVTRAGFAVTPRRRTRARSQVANGSLEIAGDKPASNV